MKTKLFLFISFCTLLFCEKGLAQDQDNDPIVKQDSDYVINLKNDTIMCTIKSITYITKTTAYYRVKWRTKEEKKWKDMDLNYVKEYFTSEDTSNFVSKSLPGNDKIDYVQWIERGKINLYGNFWHDEWFANKDGSELMQVKINQLSFFTKGTHKARINAFMNLIADNPDLLKRFKEAIKSADYTFELIQYYIKTYNEEYLENNKVSK